MIISGRCDTKQGIFGDQRTIPMSYVNYVPSVYTADVVCDVE